MWTVATRQGLASYRGTTTGLIQGHGSGKVSWQIPLSQHRQALAVGSVYKLKQKLDLTEAQRQNWLKAPAWPNSEVGGRPLLRTDSWALESICLYLRGTCIPACHASLSPDIDFIAKPEPIQFSLATSFFPALGLSGSVSQCAGAFLDDFCFARQDPRCRVDGALGAHHGLCKGDGVDAHGGVSAAGASPTSDFEWPVTAWPCRPFA